MHLAYLIKNKHAIFIGCYFAKYNMQTKFVAVECDVYCEWNNQPPRYRAYVNNELFIERTWIWKDAYLREKFQIQALPGQYQIRYEPLDGAKITLENWKVHSGPAGINQQGNLVIHNESS
jgi:hypothetical protein